VPAGIGVAVLGDAVRAGWAVVAVVATVAAIGASVALAMSPAAEAAQHPSAS
ncbi:MAG: hypothetical protein HGA51_09305, partial [Demequinaceae bacterium]|nr:hypothetical protein [Demequinaceae bacterium]